MNNPVQQAQVRLYIGTPEHTCAAVLKLLMQYFCTQNGCSSCFTCQSIAHKRYSSLLWITPERGYTRELLEPVFHAISFMRAQDQCFFIILEQIDMLTPACANSLLKSLEEPPTGYYFILLSATRAILPAIVSRCTTIEVTSGTSKSTTDDFLLSLFTTPITAVSGARLLKELEKLSLSERQVLFLIEKLIEQSMHDYSTTKNTQAYRDILTMLLHKPPMPGSSKLALRTIALQHLLFSKIDR